jgi:hypothetical protein
VITCLDPLQPHGQIESLPQHDAKHGTVDHGKHSNNVFLQLWGRRGRASTSSFTSDCLLGLGWMVFTNVSLGFFWSNLSFDCGRPSQYLPSFLANGGVANNLESKKLLAEERGHRTVPGVGRANRPGPTLAKLSCSFLPAVHLDILHIFPNIRVILAPLAP